MQREREKIRISALRRDVLMNFITLADEAWMKDSWSIDDITKFMSVETLDSDFLLAMFWRLMDDDSKMAVAKLQVFKWNGVKESDRIEVTFDDPIEKLKHIVSGAAEILRIYEALLLTRMKSLPEVKKSEEKKSPAARSSPNARSSSSSPPSTGGLETNSNNIPLGNYPV